MIWSGLAADPQAIVRAVSVLDAHNAVSPSAQKDELLEKASRLVARTIHCESALGKVAAL